MPRADVIGEIGGVTEDEAGLAQIGGIQIFNFQRTGIFALESLRLRINLGYHDRPLGLGHMSPVDIGRDDIGNRVCAIKQYVIGDNAHKGGYPLP